MVRPMTFDDLFTGWKDVEEMDAQEVIFSEQDRAEAMYYILSGEVELSLHGQAIGIETQGGVIGEMAVVESARQKATATTLTQVKLARVDKNQLKDLISNNTDFSLHVMAVLANRLSAVDKFISGQIDEHE